MLNNIKTKQRGFTIVELLIVIVVIAILAAITIVAYNGIQNRGKASSAASLANVVVKKLEAYNTLNSTYPATITAFKAGTDEAALDASTQAALQIAAPTDEKKIQYRYCDTGKGAQVIYYDATVPGTKTVTVGTQTSCANVAS